MDKSSKHMESKWKILFVIVLGIGFILINCPPVIYNSYFIEDVE